MARNGAGTFAVLNPIVVGALRSSSAVNANFTDAGDEITNSLPLDGVVGMNGGQFKAFDGSALQPGITFANDLNLGFRRSAANEMKWVAGGVDRATMAANGKLTLPAGLAVSGDITGASGGAIGDQTFISSVSATPALTLRRTENDTTERELAQYQSGDGSGAKGSLRQVGGGANDVATLRYYVNDVLAFQWTGNLFTYSVDAVFGGLRIDADGFMDFTELSAAPSAPAANAARIYARDDGNGASHMYLKDGSGTETPFAPPTDYQVFTNSDTWTKPTQGQTMALIEVWGGGGSGERRTNEGTADAAGGGGGGGSYFRRVIALASLSNSVSVTVAAGGATVNTSNTSGNLGGDSSFGSYLTGYGGAGGSGQSGGGGGGITSDGNFGGGSSGGSGGSPRPSLDGVQWGAGGDKTFKSENNSNPFGGAGNSGNGVDGAEGALWGGGGGGIGNSGEFGGFSIWGGAGGGGADTSSDPGANGGVSVLAGNGGRGRTGSTPASDGSAPAGGGGGSEDAASGAGGRGEVRVTSW